MKKVLIIPFFLFTYIIYAQSTRPIQVEITDRTEIELLAAQYRVMQQEERAKIKFQQQQDKEYKKSQINIQLLDAGIRLLNIDKSKFNKITKLDYENLLRKKDKIERKYKNNPKKYLDFISEIGTLNMDISNLEYKVAYE